MNASVDHLADTLATALEVSTREKLDILLRQGSHPKLDYSAILSDVFASKEDMAAVQCLEVPDMRKFFRRCQLVCRDPSIQQHILTLLQHHVALLQQATRTTFPLEITPHELLAQSKIPLAQGGVALIWRGTWLGGAHVAVKKLRVPFGQDEMKALRKEVGVMRQLEHRHVLPLWGFNHAGWEGDGEEDETGVKRPFLVVPWMENGSACAYLRTTPDANRLKIIDEISSAVSYLHQAGVVHGDLKGDNILIDGASSAFLSDFGNCVVTEDVLSLEPVGSSILGAVRWTAPERLRGGPSTERTDVFAWAMTILELMTDLPPFADLPSDVLANKAIQSHLRPARPSSSKLAMRGLNTALWTLIERMWAPVPRARPTAAEVREEMRVLRAAFERAKAAERRADEEILVRTGFKPACASASVAVRLKASAGGSRTSRGSTTTASVQTASSTSSCDAGFPQTPRPRNGTAQAPSTGGFSGTGKSKSTKAMKNVFGIGRGLEPSLEY